MLSSLICFLSHMLPSIWQEWLRVGMEWLLEWSRHIWISPQTGLRHWESKASQAEGIWQGTFKGSFSLQLFVLYSTHSFAISVPTASPAGRHSSDLSVDTYARGKAASLETRSPLYETIWEGQTKAKKEGRRGSTFGRRRPKEKKIIKLQERY